ncbi:MAG: hypothetical protein NTY35_12655 [Planctomycetota bacterium]|nr:hypothetical protein [Planctomycetota bacterium]
MRNACVRNLAFDPQIEDDRAGWLIGLLDSVGGPGPWMEYILRALPATENWHDALQLARLLDLLAERGDGRARAVLDQERRLARFGKADEDGTDWVLGPWPASPPEPERSGPGAPDLPAPAVVELEAVLELLVLTKELPERRKLTGPLLRARELPYTPRAVELLAHADASIRSSASSLVERMKDPRLRAEGLRRIRADGFHGLTTSLLLRNLEPEDVALLEQHLPARGDPFALHDACSAIATLSSSAPHAGWRNACLWTYEWSPCGLCRSDVVKRLDGMGDVPDELRYEWRFDADATTRALGLRSNAPG